MKSKSDTFFGLGNEPTCVVKTVIHYFPDVGPGLSSVGITLYSVAIPGFVGFKVNSLFLGNEKVSPGFKIKL